MSDLAYKKYGFTVNDNSEAMQAGIDSQKKNLTDVLAGVTGLMKTQEDRYKQENTLNVQNYFKDKLQAGGLNAALTQPINQEEIKAKFGDRIDLGAVNTTATAQTDLLKRTAIESAVTEADKHLTVEGGRDPLKATAAFKNALLANGATTAFADEQLPSYIAKKATEVQNIQTAKLQEHETRVNHVLDMAAKIDPVTKKSGGHDAGMMAIEASIASLPENEKRAARESLRTELEKAGELTKYQTTIMKDYNDAYAVEGTRRVNDAKNKSIVLKDQLKLALDNGVQEKYIKAVASSGGITDAKGNLSQSIVNQLGDAVNNPIEKWAGAFSESGKLRQIRRDLGDKLPGDTADAILLQAFQDAYDGGGFFGNDLNQAGFDRINSTVARLTANYENKVKLTQAATAADINVSEVEADVLQNAVNLRRSLFAAGRDEQLSRGKSVTDPLTSESIDKTYANFKAKMGFGKTTTPPPVDGDTATTAPQTNAQNAKAAVEAEKKKINNISGKTTVVPASPDPSVPAAAATHDNKKVLLAKDAPQKLVPDAIKNIFNGGLQKWADSLNADAVAKMGGGASTAEASTGPVDPVRAATDRRNGIVGVGKDRYNIKSYATKDGHENSVAKIYNSIPNFNIDIDIDKYISKVAPSSKVTGKMVMASAKKYNVSPKMMIAVMQADSSIGTAGLGVKTNNPGNVGNDDAGNKVYYEALRDGVDAVARNLSKRKIKGTK